MSRGKCHNGKNYLCVAVLSELFKFSTVLLLLFNINTLFKLCTFSHSHPPRKEKNHRWQVFNESQAWRFSLSPVPWSLGLFYGPSTWHGSAL